MKPNNFLNKWEYNNLQQQQKFYLLLLWEQDCN